MSNKHMICIYVYHRSHLASLLALSLWISFWKAAPSSSEALAMPCQLLMLQSRTTPSCSSETDRPPEETPPKAFWCQGKEIVLN